MGTKMKRRKKARVKSHSSQVRRQGVISEEQISALRYMSRAAEYDCRQAGLDTWPKIRPSCRLRNGYRPTQLSDENTQASQAPDLRLVRLPKPLYRSNLRMSDNKGRKEILAGRTIAECQTLFSLQT